MAVVNPTDTGRPPAQAATVNIAGTAWPVYKLEALAAAAAVALLIALITGSAQAAVLAAATAAALRWVFALVRA